MTAPPAAWLSGDQQSHRDNAHPNFVEHLPPTHSSGGAVRNRSRSSKVGKIDSGKKRNPPKPDQGRLDRLRDRRDEFSFGEHGHGVSSLLEEKARLRALALTLSTMI